MIVVVNVVIVIGTKRFAFRGLIVIVILTVILILILRGSFRLLFLRHMVSTSSSLCRHGEERMGPFDDDLVAWRMETQYSYRTEYGTVITRTRNTRTVSVQNINATKNTQYIRHV